MPPLPPPLLLAPPAGDICACVVNINNNDSRNRNGTLYTRAAVGGRYVQVQQLLYTKLETVCFLYEVRIYVHVYSSITQARSSLISRIHGHFVSKQPLEYEHRGVEYQVHFNQLPTFTRSAVNLNKDHKRCDFTYAKQCL